MTHSAGDISLDNELQRSDQADYREAERDDKHRGRQPGKYLGARNSGEDRRQRRRDLCASLAVVRDCSLPHNPNASAPTLILDAP